MRKHILRSVLAAACLALASTGCGGGGDPARDPGGSPDAPADADAADAPDAPEAPPDPGPGDDGREADGPAEPDAPLDAPPDAPPDLPPEAGDVPADVPADAAPDLPPPFRWAAGCEGTGTGASWTAIPDTTFHRGPLVQMSDRDRVTLLWRTATPVADEGCADLAWEGGSRTACGPADAQGQYEVEVAGLPPATEVTYTVRTGEARTAPLTFRTMPDRPIPMKIAVFADAHNHEENLRRMAAVALAEGVDLAVAVGDIAGQGLPEEYDLVFKGWADLGSRVNIWTVIGNHDEKNIQGYFDAFAMPQGNEDEIEAGLGEGWWARRIGNAWLGGGWVRDFYLSLPDSDWGQVGWFRRQFQGDDFRTAQWRLFFIHQPPYTTQWGDECGYDGEDCLKVALVPLMAEFGIQASFHGHMHGIEWGVVDGVHTFIAGGGFAGGLDNGHCATPEGFPQPWNAVYGIANFAIVETGCDALVVRYLDLDGTLLARVEVPAAPAGD